MLEHNFWIHVHWKKWLFYVGYPFLGNYSYHVQTSLQRNKMKKNGKLWNLGFLQIKIETVTCFTAPMFSINLIKVGTLISSAFVSPRTNNEINIVHLYK